MGNEQSVRPDTASPMPTATSVANPMKSAMRRSSSMRNGTGLSESSSGSTRYIPKMNGTEKGIIMPTRPHGMDHVGGGVDSPQWGWYINTTPPTPEMYYSQSTMNKKVEAKGNGPPRPTSQPVVPAEKAKCQHNQVFKNLQSNNTPMGWTSVPI